MKSNKSILIPGLMLAVIISLISMKVVNTTPETISNKVLLDWNVAAYEAMGGKSYQHSLMASRINAMVHIAMHDAINAIEPKYEQYAYNKTASGADMETAAAYAAHTVLVASFPNKKSMLDTLLYNSLINVKDGKGKTKGIKVGMEAGNAILARRDGDGAELDPIVPLKPTTTPGAYNTVPPFNFVFAPHWKTMKLFGVEKHNQFRPGPPPALNSEVYKTSFKEVKNFGDLKSKTRTLDQTFYSKFWYEFSEIGWNRVARTVATDKKMDLVESARLFALLNMALADAYTTGWDAKFHYNFWRPYTAIRAAEGSDWESAEPTPPVQDYPSTHSALGNAAAQVLISVVGDATPFTMTSYTAMPVGATRSFKRFSEAADENADSRVMAGLHFRFSCEAGQKLGDDVGSYIMQHHLKPRK